MAFHPGFLKCVFGCDWARLSSSSNFCCREGIELRFRLANEKSELDLSIVNSLISFCNLCTKYAKLWTLYNTKFLVLPKRPRN